MKYQALNNGSYEIWKDIKGVDKGYKVSNMGRIMSSKSGVDIILKPYSAGKNYCMVALRNNGGCKRMYVHRIVAQYFISNPKKYPEVNHIDGDKSNNKRSNLNWTDGVGNMKHSRENLGFNQSGENSGTAKLTESDVRNMISLYNTGGFSFKEIADKFNISSGHAHGVVNRKFWKHLKIA